MRRTALFLVLTALLPFSANAASITVKSGETLSDIADRYGVSVRALMRLNGINNPDHVEIGSRLQVPGPKVNAGSGRHRVTTGESLSSIAGRYRISGKDLMAVNGLRNPNHIEIGQTLKLPANAVTARPSFKPVAVKPVPGATQHKVAKGQTLTQIAKAYRLPISTLISINQLENPNKVEVGTRLYLTNPSSPAVATEVRSNVTQTPRTQTARTQTAQTQTTARTSPTPKPQPRASEPVRASKPAKSTKPAKKVVAKAADWRNYGPLQVDWANWQPMAGSQVVPTLNSKGQALYVAVNCSAGKINSTGSDGSWKPWAAPQTSFEKDLVKDRCQAKA